MFFESADTLANNRVIFTIGGNKYRLISGIHIAKEGRRDIVYTIWIDTHAEYDKIDATLV